MNALLMSLARLRKQLLLSVCALAMAGALVVSKPVSAQAVVCVNCSTVVTQLAEYAQQALQYAKQIEQYNLQINQYNNMLQNSVNLPRSYLDNALNTVRNIEGVMNNASNIRYMMTNLDAQYTQYYPGVYGRLQQMAGLSPQQSLLDGYARQRQSYDSALTALKAAQLQSQDLQDDQYRMDAIGGTLIGASGHLDAMQAAGEYGQISAQQMMKLRQLALVQIQLESQRMSAQADKEDLSRANLESWIQARPQQPLQTPHTSDGF